MFRTPMDIYQAIQLGKLDIAKQKLSGNGGPYRVVRFETFHGALSVILEDSKKDHHRLYANQTMFMNLEIMPPSEPVILYDD